MADEKIYSPTADDIAAAKAKFGRVWLVLADPSDPEGDAVIIRRCSKLEYHDFATAPSRINAQENLTTAAVVWPVPRSDDFFALFKKLPAFVTAVSDKVTDVSGHVAGGKAIPL